MHKAIIAIGIVAAASLIAGCGSSSDETAEVAVTKAQFIKQAEAICDRTRDEVQDAATAWEETNDERLDINTAFEQIIGPALTREAEKLQALTPPEADAARLTRMIRSLSNGGAASTKSGPSSQKSASSIEAFEQEANAYGLGACQL